MIMDRLYGGVCYAGIDTDPELRYPVCGVFNSKHFICNSYMSFYFESNRKELGELLSLINKVTLLQSVQDLYSCNMETLKKE